MAFFGAYFDDRECFFEVSPEYFLDLDVVYLPHTKHPWHPGPTTRPQPHGTRNICRMTTNRPKSGVTLFV
jgi:hypothetical protein